MVKMRRKLTEDEKFMRSAIAEARKAKKIGEVPIGCVIVKDGKIIARGYNKRKKEGNTLSHAEIKAIDKACKKTGDWRLEGCSMYVTLEPCPMCAGALIQSRIDKVFIGCMNPKAGCAGSVLDMFSVDGFNHHPECVRGILQEECSDMLKEFFRELRKRLREEKASDGKEPQ
ncbi:MAG: tRNA adenosine(34) deaminase TadA [Candidatus Avilachnospira sp.]|jgi:tRNA(adenine34) deaminase